MDYDFALITLKDAASASAGFLGMTVGQGSVTLNLTTAGYPVRAQPLPQGSADHVTHRSARVFWIACSEDRCAENAL
jgi:hypothetical protein